MSFVLEDLSSLNPEGRLKVVCCAVPGGQAQSAAGSGEAILFSCDPAARSFASKR